MARTAPAWPSITATSRAGAKSQTLTTPPAAPARIRLPSGVTAIDSSLPAGSRMTSTSLPASMSHTRIVPSRPAETTLAESGRRHDRADAAAMSS